MKLVISLLSDDFLYFKPRFIILNMRFLTIIAFSLLGFMANCAELPIHPALRILIVSDEVNPHNLSNAELTQPNEISTALTAVGSGLNIDLVTEIATNDIDQATALLNLPTTDPGRYDVLIYFAHRIPNDGTAQQNQDDQDAFTTAVESFLETGGGVVCFHHGLYSSSGKDGILSVMGGTASGNVPWNTSTGQNVINVSPSHFVTTNSVEYTTQTTYADATNGVASGTYAYFNNTPDERYPYLTINNDAENVEMLFASNYSDNGSTHILGFTHQRSTWSGRVVFYQPGEYQPNALDDLEGNNFQILANAIYYSAFGNVTTGIATTSYDSEFNLYPNPTTDAINLSIPKDERLMSVRLFNALGGLVLADNNSRLNLEHLPAGIYSVQIGTDLQTETRTVIKH